MDIGHNHHGGFSLIEMMVALVIGSFLVLGVSQIYINSKRNFIYQQSQSGNRDNALLIEQLLNWQLARAGFRANTQVQGSLAAAFPALDAAVDKNDHVGCSAFGEGAVLVPTSEDAANPSGVCLRYQGAIDGKDLDCLGNLISPKSEKIGGNILTKLRYVVGETIGSGRLTCTVWSEQNGVLTPRGSSVLIQGLLDFRWAALNVNGEAPAVRYAVLLATSDASAGGVTSNVVANWQALTGRQIKEAAYVMQIVQSSVALRNLAP